MDGRDLVPPLTDRDATELCFGMVADALRELPLVAILSADLAAVALDAVLDFDLGDEVRDRVLDRRAGAAAAAGFADDMLFAAVISALAAVVIALVAVFIDCIADDMVLADAVALVAAAVILVAADVTFVAADDTPLAAVAVLAVPRLEVLCRTVLRLVLLRLAVLRLLGRLVVLRRAAVERDAVAREAVDRDAGLRVDRDAELRVDALDAVLPDGVAEELRLPDGLELDVLELDVVLDRLAVPRDALRVTGLLRAELAELRRFAARVVDLTGTDSPPVLINYEECYSTHGEYLHTRHRDRPEQ
jgi:hypothetical protein